MRIRRLFFVAATAILLAGCGKDTEDEVSPTPVESEDKELESNGNSEPTPTNTPTPEPTAEPTKAAENFLELYRDDFHPSPCRPPPCP